MEKAFIFFEILSGVLILRRISDEIRRNFLFNERQLTKIVAAFLLANMLLIRLSTRSLSLFTLVWAVIVCLIASLPSLTRLKRQNEMKRQIPFILNALILNLRTGMALRPAILKVAEQFGGYSGLKLRLLHEHLVVKATMAQVDPVLFELQVVLKDCDREPHLISQRLSTFRHKLSVQESFIKKRQRALHQIRAQSAILTLIYVGVFIFVVRRFGFAEHGQNLLFSLMLFVAGVFVTFRQGAKIKWKS